MRCRQGNMLREVCRLPLLDSLPIEFDATRTGPRAISWRSDKAATLKWVEAQARPSALAGLPHAVASGLLAATLWQQLAV